MMLRLVLSLTIFESPFICSQDSNSGKSTIQYLLLDKLIEENKKVLIIDPTEI